MKILIATPAYRDQVLRGYHETIAQMVSIFAERFPFVTFEQRLIDVPLLTTARNILASIVLADESYSHLLFVDADMAFSPLLVARMLRLSKPVVGVFYPEKRIDWERLGKAMTPERSTLQARLVAAGYVCQGEEISEIYDDGRKVTRVVDGFVRAHLCGAGVLLIERRVLETLRETNPELWIAEPGEQIRRWGLEQGGLLQCFDTRVNEAGFMVGEDVAFCLRWTETGGEIWTAVDEAVVHSGTTRCPGHALVALASDPKLTVRMVDRRGKGRDDAWYRRVLAAPSEASGSAKPPSAGRGPAKKGGRYGRRR